MMDVDQIRKLLKRAAIAGVFFVLALLFYQLGWRSVLIGYALVVTVAMILVILLQSGRGGGLASMGGMQGSNLLGARASTPIAKATYVMGALFLFICMLAARLGNIESASPEILRPDTPQREEQPETTDTEEASTPNQPADDTSGEKTTPSDDTSEGEQP